MSVTRNETTKRREQPMHKPRVKASALCKLSTHQLYFVSNNDPDAQTRRLATSIIRSRVSFG